MVRRKIFGVIFLLTVATGSWMPTAQAGGRRVGDEGSGWPTVPSAQVPILLANLPPGLGFPASLKIGVLGAAPVTVDQLTGPLTPNTVRQGFAIAPGNVAVPAVLAVTNDATGDAFDAQAPVWLAAPLKPVCPAFPLLTYYACPTTLLAGLKLEWGSPTEQIMFLNLSTPAGAQLYDSADYTCTPQGFDYLSGAPCHYDNVGRASSQAWELAFNCDQGGCQYGGALQWRGKLYTATADLLQAPSPTNPQGPTSNNPQGGPALNEFVFNGGKLYPPPGWLSFMVTQTSLSGAKCEFVPGAALTFRTSVTPSSDDGPVIPAGTVTLLDGTTTLATATLDQNGQAKFTISLTTSGLHSLTVAYAGNSVFAPSVSAADALVSQDQYTLLKPPGCP